MPVNMFFLLILRPNLAFRGEVWYTVLAEVDIRQEKEEI